MNPYWDKSFFQFFPLFFSRLFQMITGSLSLRDLPADELQVFVLILISIGASLVGTFLVLKKMTMLANSLSHTILLGIIIAYLVLFPGGGKELTLNFKVLILAAFATGILTTFLTQILHRGLKLQEDASIGLVFTTLFALGIVLVTLYTRNAHIGLEIVMGNADSLHQDDLKIALGVTCVNILFVLLCFKELKLICFDGELAATLGFFPAIFNYLLMLMTAATAISAFRAIGVLLFLAFLVGLPLIARLWVDQLGKGLFLACGIGTGCSLIGVAFSRHLLTVYHIPVSTAGLVVTLIGGVFALTVAFQFIKLKVSFLNPSFSHIEKDPLAD